MDSSPRRPNRRSRCFGGVARDRPPNPAPRLRPVAVLFLEVLEGRDLLTLVPGLEMLVNSTTTGSQGTPALAFSSTGASAIVWEGVSAADADGGIHLQRFDASGAAAGGETLVNSTTTNVQARARIAMNAGGAFVVVWQSLAQDGSLNGVYAQRFSAAGAKIGGEIAVNTTTLGQQLNPDVAIDSVGNFTVVWRSATQDPDNSSGVYGQRFSAAGAKLGTEFRVNTTTVAAQQAPAIACDSAGNFVVVWQSFLQDGDDFGVYMQRYSAAGAKLGGETLVTTTTAGEQSNPAIAMHSSGTYVVAWLSAGEDGDAGGIYARRFAADGTALAAPFLVNQTTAFNQTSPRVAVASDGGFLVTWVNNDDATLADAEIYARLYDSAGVAQGGEFQANSTAAPLQAAPVVGFASSTRFVVAWQSADQDGDSLGVYRRVYDVVAGSPPPAILLGGSTGTESDALPQSFTWSASASAGLAPVAVSILQGSTPVHSSGAASGSFVFDSLGLGDFTLSIEAVDLLGQKTTSTRSVTVSDDDVVAPAILLGGSAGTELDSAAQLFTWSISDPSGVAGISVIVRRDGATIHTSSAASGSFDFDSYGLGVYTLDVSTSDADADWVGDSLSNSASRTVAVSDDDVSPPTILLGGSSGTELDSAAQLFTWSISDPSGVAGVSVIVRRDGATIHTSSAASGSFDFDSYGLGVYTLDVSASDADADWAGDSLSNSATRSVAVSDDDVVAPAILLGGSTGAELDSAAQTFTWSVGDVGGLAAVAVEVKRNGVSIFTSASANGSFNFDGYGAGDYAIDVSATDADADWAGDSLSTTASRMATVSDDDASAPVILLGGSSGSELDSAPQQFTWSISDPSGLGAVSVVVRRDGAVIHTSVATSGSFDFNGYGVGEYTLDVSATDLDADWAGDSLSASATRTATVIDDDDVAPLVLLGGSSGAEFDSAPQQFTWSVSDSSGLAAISVVVRRDGTILYAGAAASGSFDFDSFGTGVYTLDVSASDLDADWAGDSLSASATRTATVIDDDDVAPLVLLGGSSGAEFDSAPQQFTWSVSDSSGLAAISVVVRRDGTILYAGAAASGSFDFDSFGTGVYTLDVSASDADSDGAGDSLSASATRTATVIDDDDVAPLVLLGGSSGAEFDSAPQQFTWSVFDSSGLAAISIVVRRDGATIYTSAAASGSFDFDSYGTGVYTLDVSASDGDADGTGDALSTSASRSATVTDDDVSPPAILLGGSVGAELDSAPQLFTWSIADASGFTGISIVVRRDGATIFTSTAASGSFDFDGYGVGIYTLDASATDADSDGSGDFLSTSASRSATVTDDDVVPPAILLGGSSGAESDGAPQLFTWAVGDAGGLAAVVVEVRRDGVSIFTSAAAGGSFDFDAYGPGAYTLEVSAVDADADWIGDSLGAVASRSVTVTDDDVAAPAILLGGSSSAELDSAPQQFTWSISDPSGLADVSVVVRRGGATIYSSGAADGSFDFDGYGPGSYTLDVSASDGDADWISDSLSASASRSVAVSDDDNASPVIVLGGSSGLELDSADQVFTWDVSDPSGLSAVLVEVKKYGISIFTTTAASGAFDFNGYGLGEYTLEVSATDADGDWSGDSLPATSVRSVVVSDDDAAPPTILLGGSSGLEFDSADQGFTWSVSDPSGLSAAVVEVKKDGVSIFTSTSTSGAFDFNGYGLGEYTLEVSATDADGDWTGDALAASASRSATVGDDDVAPPTIVLGGSSGLDFDSADQIFTWDFSDPSGSSKVAVEVKKDGVSIFNSTAASGAFDFNSFGIGDYTLEVSASDGDGDWTGDALSASASRAVAVSDNDAAPPTILLGGSSGFEFDADDQSFTWNVSDASGLSVVSVEVKKDGVSIFNSAASSGAFDFNSFGRGEYAFEVSATDADGDWKGDALAASASRSATVGDDDVAPPTIVLGGSSGAEFDSADQKFTWSADDPSGLATVAVVVLRDGVSIFTSAAASGEFDFNGCGVGVYTLEISAFDADGELPDDSLSASTSRSVTVSDDDSIPPAILLGGSNGAEPDSSDQIFTWSVGDASGLATVSVSVTRDGASIYNSTAASGSFDFNSYGVGVYTLQVSAADSDGDWNGDALSASSSRSVSVADEDLSGPVVLLGGSSGTELDSSDQSFNWNVGDSSGLLGVAVEVKKDGIAIFNSNAASGSFDFNSYGVGEYALEVSAADADDDWAGDGLSAAASLTVAVVDDDAAGPTIVLGGSDGAELDSADQSFTWNVGDASGLASLMVEVKRDGATIFTSTAASGAFDFNALGTGTFTLEVSATDSDGDWSGDAGAAAAGRSVVVADDDASPPVVTVDVVPMGDGAMILWSATDGGSGIGWVEVVVVLEGVVVHQEASSAAAGAWHLSGDPGGSYSVRVEARDADGDWSGDAASGASERQIVFPADDAADLAFARAAEQGSASAASAFLGSLEAQRRAVEAAFAVPRAGSGASAGAVDSSESFESSADRIFASGDGDFAAAPLDDLVRLRSMGRPGRAASVRDARDGKVVVVLRGSDGDDHLEVRRRGAVEVELFAGGVSVGRYPRAAVSLFVLDGRGGDDRLELDAELGVPGWLFGGDGDDALSGGAAADRLFGEGGRDRLDGRGGADELHLETHDHAAVDAAEDVVHPVP